MLVLYVHAHTLLTCWYAPWDHLLLDQLSL